MYTKVQMRERRHAAEGVLGDVRKERHAVDTTDAQVEVRAQKLHAVRRGRRAVGGFARRAHQHAGAARHGVVERGIRSLLHAPLARTALRHKCAGHRRLPGLLHVDALVDHPADGRRGARRRDHEAQQRAKQQQRHQRRRARCRRHSAGGDPSLATERWLISSAAPRAALRASARRSTGAARVRSTNGEGEREMARAMGAGRGGAEGEKRNETVGRRVV
mmetsp:Transcript_9021/g.27976  ORF Transcript_9021/g.27976 Transcript_9021/m.27976 type:complete len:219 (+) Transcript_9021:2267-2923(+)